MEGADVTAEIPQPLLHCNRLKFLLKKGRGETDFHLNPYRSYLPRERMCSWAILAEKVAAAAS